MRFILTLVVALGLAFGAETAQAEALSGSALKAKLTDTVVMMSRNGRKIRRRIELTLNKGGNGQWFNGRTNQSQPITWQVKGNQLCIKPKGEGDQFCMTTAVEGDKIIAQSPQSGRQLKGSITPIGG